MSVLAEELIIKIGADISSLKREMERAKKETDSAAKAAGKFGNETEKAAKKGESAFMGMRKEALFLRANILLATAAITAIATPILRADDAMKSLQGTATLFGKDGAKVLADVKAQADALRVGYGDAAKAAQAALVGTGSVKGAVADMKLALDLGGMGLGDPAQIAAGLEAVSKAFGLTKAQAADLGVQAAALGANFVNVLQSAVTLKPAMAAVGVDFKSLLENMAALQKGGASPEQAFQVIKTVIENVRNPTDQFTGALDKMNIQFTDFMLSGRGLATVLEMLKSNMSGMSGEVQDALGGSQGLADVLGGGGSSTAFLDNSGKIKAGLGQIKEAADAAKSSLDSIKESMDLIANTLTTLTPAITTLASAFSTLAGAIAGLPNIPGWLYDFGFDIGWKIGGGGKKPDYMATGGAVGGSGNGDTVPAMLTPGEFVIRKDVAKNLMPFLSMLNAGGIDPRNLWGTPISKAQIGGKSVLGELLGIPNDANRMSLMGTTGGKMRGSSIPSIQAEQNLLMSRVVAGMRGVLGFANGGMVPNRGPSHSTSIEGGVNINVSGQSFTQAVVRRQLVPMIQREVAGARPQAATRSRR